MTDKFKTWVYAEYRSKVLGYIISKVGNVHTAEDICAEVFVKIYENLDSFDENRASLSTWIFTVTRNTLIDRFRTRHVFSEIPDDYESDDSVEEEICRTEMLEALASVIESLDEKKRSIIILHYYSGLSLKDIAERINLSYSYVKVLHTNALKELKNKLKI